MSHNINFNEEKGTYSVVSAAKPMWHGVGKILDNIFTAKEAIEYANLGYNVEKRKLLTLGAFHTEGDQAGNAIAAQENIEIPDMYATVRTDNNTPLGVVGSKYTVLQNVDAFKFFDSIVGEGKAIYETAGVLGKGERIFITAKLPEKLVVAPNDAIDQYLFITNSHDGSGSITAAFTPVRIVCNNTLAMALSQSTHKVKFRHTISAHDNLNGAAKMMGIAIAQGKDMEEAYKEMVKIKITDAELRKFIDLAMNPKKEQISEDEWSTRFKNVMGDVMEYAHTDSAQLLETTKGTLFGAFNAVTGYYNNVVQYKNPEDKLNKIMYGQAMRNSNKAYDLALDVLSNNLKLS